MNVDDAIARIEESRSSHVKWSKHLAECTFCQENPPDYIQTKDEHDKIVSEYDNVLDILKRYKRQVDKFNE